ITLHSESASVDSFVVEDYILEFPKIREGYEDADIFNIDETALYIRKPINKFYVINKNMDNKNIKFNKTRVTLMLGYNMIEDELTPLLIGVSKIFRCFKDNDLSSLGVKYVSSKPAWMTANIFSNYLKDLNEDLIKQKRPILLILDNFSGHKIANLSNIKLKFLPKNAISIIQPLDQGVIKAFKSKYLRILNSYLVSSSRIEKQNIQQLVKGIDLYTVINWVRKSIDCVDRFVIVNSWKKSGLLCGEQQQKPTDVQQDQPGEDKTFIGEDVDTTILDIDEFFAPVNLSPPSYNDLFFHLNKAKSLLIQLGSDKKRDLLDLYDDLVDEYNKTLE
ncbi:Tigger transposable element-derived protein 4, partial [Cucumispora dikerogammari]